MPYYVLKLIIRQLKLDFMFQEYCLLSDRFCNLLKSLRVKPSNPCNAHPIRNTVASRTSHKTHSFAVFTIPPGHHVSPIHFFQGKGVRVRVRVRVSMIHSRPVENETKGDGRVCEGFHRG